MVKRKGLGSGIAQIRGIKNDLDKSLENRDIVFDNNKNIQKENNNHDIEIKKLDIHEICPASYSLRQDIDIEYLERLSSSIKEFGLVQPVVVSPVVNKDSSYKFQLIAGEMRWRACLKLNIKHIPAVIKKSKNQFNEIFESLIENIHRLDLNPIEEALAYKHIIDSTGCTMSMLAKYIGYSTSYISCSLQLLNLPSEVQNYLKKGFINTGHCKVLNSLDNDKDKIQIAEHIIQKSLSVSQLDAYIKNMKSVNASNEIIESKLNNAESVENSNDIANGDANNSEELELNELKDKENSYTVTNLRGYFKNRLNVILNDKDKGEICIPFATKDEFSAIVARLQDSV